MRKSFTNNKNKMSDGRLAWGLLRVDSVIWKILYRTRVQVSFVRHKSMADEASDKRFLSFLLFPLSTTASSRKQRIRFHVRSVPKNKLFIKLAIDRGAGGRSSECTFI